MRITPRSRGFKSQINELRNEAVCKPQNIVAHKNIFKWGHHKIANTYIKFPSYTLFITSILQYALPPYSSLIMLSGKLLQKIFLFYQEASYWQK